MDIELKRRVTKHLLRFMSDERCKRMQAVLKNRTRYVSVILEDIFQPHNASAVLRSCDCFGVQQVFTVENRNKLDVSSGVSLKAHQWLSLSRYRTHADNLSACIDDVKNQGYLVAATTPHTNDMLIHELPLDKPLALMFGSEKEGLTSRAVEMADCCVRIPMYGFSESFNISVSAAISLYEVTRRVREAVSPEIRGLSETEQELLMYDWLKLTIRGASGIEAKFLDSLPSSSE